MPVAVLQPFVPGTPMSASFLVGQGGQSWPIGVATQRMTIREGRFEYRGGTVPAPCRDALPQLKPAVEAIDGLRGFVGVDFIWNAKKRHATILEINPRPTTSYVGLSRLAPPGLLARAWLAACEPLARDTETLASLAECIHGKQGFVSFRANGELSYDHVGAFVT
jgi:predicted ATP-grasp superfamily ATP-dependent carboligase